MNYLIIKKIAGLVISMFIISTILNPAIAQQATIFGKVEDSAHNMLSYATVNIYNFGNSTKILKSTYSDKAGLYKFTNIDTGRYDIIFSFAGFIEQKISVTVPVSVKLLEIPDVLLVKETKEMPGVTVIVRKKLIDINDDGISYNAEADPMANSDKLIDLLRKTPLVTVDANGNVEINGQSSFKVLLNGRETSMFARNTKEALKSFPGSLVKRIDIITNPSAKYDAEGVGGIINIITKKKVLGYNGSVNFEANNLTYRGANASLNFKYGKIGFTAFAGLGGNNGTKFNEEETILALTPATFYSRKTEGKNKQNNSSPEVNIELAYDTDSLNTFTLYGSADWSSRNDYINSLFTLVPSSQIGYEQSYFNSNTRVQTPGWSAGTDYIHKFRNNKEQELSVKFFGSNGTDKTNNTSEQTGNSSSRFIRNESKAKDRQYTIQADYIHSLKYKQKLELGVKVIIRRAASNYESFVKFNVADDFKLNPGNSDNFSYHQNVYSIYASHSFSIKKLNIRTGLRMEHTDVNGDFITSQIKVSQSYTNLVPNLLIAARLKNGHNASFNYSMRLSRPYISNLNPFVNNVDSLLVTTGNPALDPQIFHNTSLQYRFTKGKIFTNISLGNSYSSSYIIYSYIFDNTSGVTTAKPLNGGVSNRIYLNMGINANPVDKWRLNINGGISHLSVKSRIGLVKQNSGFTGNIGLNSSYNFTTKFSGTTFFNYYFPILLLQGSQNGYYAYGWGVRYNFFKNKLTFTGYMNNPFNKDGIFKRISLFEDVSFKRERVQFSHFRAFGFSLTWNFGKLNEDVSKKRSVQNNDLL